MTTPRMSSTDVSAAAAGLLGEPIAEAAALPVSYANETWRVVTYSGARHVLKIGPLDGVRRLFTDLGAALRALHEIELDGFSSRLDGSAPSFARWPDYLEQRLTAISARCRATHAVEEDELDRACGTVRRLAAAVGDRARPPFWAERVRIVALIEALNTLPNAIRAGWDSDYAEEARRRMRALLDRE